MLAPSFTLVALVLAADPVTTATTKKTSPSRNYVNFTVGAANNATRPTLCIEGSPIDLLALEMCGTGTGFLHNDPAPEVAHFRSKWKLTEWQTPIGYLQPRLGFGFAELQIGEDAQGFQFFGTGSDGMATAGLEAGASLRALFPVYEGFELIGEFSLSGAYLPFAPRLIRPQNSFQPTAAFTLGVGF